MSGGVIVEPQAHHQGSSDWIVPRRVMCAFFWVGIILLFTGIILLVTSKHKEEFYQSWGAILLGLGFCLLLICFILCMHAYCVITVSDDDGPTTTGQRQPQQQRPQDLIRKKAPLKPPPTFKIPSANSRPVIDDSVDKKKPPFSPTRLKSINENGSPKTSLSRSDSGNYGSTSSRADHVRTCLANHVSRPPSAKRDGDEEVVHYVASPPMVKISVGKRANLNSIPNENQRGPMLNNEVKPRQTSIEDARIGDNTSFKEDASSVPPRSNSKSREHISLNLTAKSLPSHIIVQNSPVCQDYHFDVSASENSMPKDMDINHSQDYGDTFASHRSGLSGSDYSCSSGSQDNLLAAESLPDDDPVERPNAPLPELYSQHRHNDDFNYPQPPLPTMYSSSRHVVDEDEIQPEYRLPAHTKTVQETNVYSKPIVTARVTQLPGNRSNQRFIPNGAPPQIGYRRQYPISAVHAYPLRFRQPHPLYSPLRVNVDPPEDESDAAPGPRQPQTMHNRLLRPVLMPIPEQQAQTQDETSPLPRDFTESTNHPFARGGSHHRHHGETSNLVNMSGMERGLTNSANIYLNPDQEFSDSKMSIYDNLNYIRI